MNDDGGGFWRPVGVGRVTDEGLDQLARWIGAAGACAGIGPDVVLGLIDEVRAARAEIARLRAAGEGLAGSVRGNGGVLFAMGVTSMAAHDRVQWEARIGEARAIMDRIAAALAAWDAAAGLGDPPAPPTPTGGPP